MNLDGIVRRIQGWAKIKGDTDGTLIGNDGDRLKTTSNFQVVFDDTVSYAANFIDNAGSVDMTVDGSTTIQTFDLGPNKVGDSRDWYVDHLGIQLDDNGSISMGDFGNIAGGLTNGIKISFKVRGTTSTFAILKTNYDIVGFFGNEGTLQNAGGGFISGNFFQGAIGMSDPKMKLVSSFDDRIIVEIRDDLTSLTDLRFFFHYYYRIT